MPILSEKESEFTADQFIWSAIMDGGEFFHVGLIFRDQNGSPKIVDLAWHYVLRCGDDINLYRWSEIGLDPINQEIMASFALRVSKTKRRIPYAPDFAGLSFDAATAELIGDAEGKGFTCATFVLGMFETMGFKPIDLASWTIRPQDEAWRNRILQLLEGNPRNAAHAKAIRDGSPSVRYRPEEVVAALHRHRDDWPATMGSIADDAAKVLGELAAG